MAVAAGTSFTATLLTPGGVDTTFSVGARVEVPVTRAIAVMRYPATMVDSTWNVTMTAPLVAGDYNLVWMTGDAVQPQPFPIFVPLFVVDQAVAVGFTPVDYPPVDMPSVTPDMADVVALERTRTRDVDTGEDQGTFNGRTSPTDVEAQAIIGQSVQLVLTGLRETFDPSHYDEVKQAAALQAAVLIEGSYYRNENESGRGTLAVWSNALSTSTAGLQTSIERDLQQSLLLGVMEPRQPNQPWTHPLS